MTQKKGDPDYMKPTDESKEKLTQTEPKEETKKITEESEKELADEKVEQVTGGRIYDFPK